MSPGVGFTPGQWGPQGFPSPDPPRTRASVMNTSGYQKCQGSRHCQGLDNLGVEGVDGKCRAFVLRVSRPGLSLLGTGFGQYSKDDAQRTFDSPQTLRTLTITVHMRCTTAFGGRSSEPLSLAHTCPPRQHRTHRLCLFYSSCCCTEFAASRLVWHLVRPDLGDGLLLAD